MPLQCFSQYNLQFVTRVNAKFFMPWRNSPVGHGLHIVEDSRSHSDTPHWVGLLRTSDQRDSETST